MDEGDIDEPIMVDFADPKKNIMVRPEGYHMAQYEGVPPVNMASERSDLAPYHESTN